MMKNLKLLGHFFFLFTGLYMALLSAAICMPDVPAYSLSEQTVLTLKRMLITLPAIPFLLGVMVAGNSVKRLMRFF